MKFKYNMKRRSRRYLATPENNTATTRQLSKGLKLEAVGVEESQAQYEALKTLQMATTTTGENCIQNDNDEELSARNPIRLNFVKQVEWDDMNGRPYDIVLTPNDSFINSFVNTSFLSSSIIHKLESELSLTPKEMDLIMALKTGRVTNSSENYLDNHSRTENNDGQQDFIEEVDSVGSDSCESSSSTITLTDNGNLPSKVSTIPKTRRRNTTTKNKLLSSVDMNMDIDDNDIVTNQETFDNSNVSTVSSIAGKKFGRSSRMKSSRNRKRMSYKSKNCANNNAKIQHKKINAQNEADLLLSSSNTNNLNLNDSKINSHIDKKTYSFDLYRDNLKFRSTIDFSIKMSILNTTVLDGVQINSAAGYLRVFPNFIKEKQSSLVYDIHFSHIDGEGLIYLADREFKLSDGSNFMVSKGTEYSIKNKSATEILVIGFVRLTYSE